MKQLSRVIFIALVLAPTCVFAKCTDTGFSVVYVNGILTTQSQAKDDLLLLAQILGTSFEGEKLDVYNGYNPSHLDGVGDILESVSQAFSEPISDYDFDSVLVQMSSEITTRKIVLVGHSQGTFYTNELYDYLVAHGIPSGSIAVYNIATPADHVAGGGVYLTSSNDKVINYVRNAQAQLHVPQALPADVTIPRESDYDSDTWGGHMPDVYFNGAATAIRSGLDGAFDRLFASSSSDTCFVPPSSGLTDEIQQTLFSVADPSIADLDYALTDAKITLVSVNKNANDIVHTALSDLYFSVFPKPDQQSAASVFSVEKALYGSSLSESDYEALLNGQNPEEVVTAPPAPSQQKPSHEVPTPDPHQIAVTQEILQPTTSRSEVAEVSTTTINSIPPIVIVSPGFGGGGEPITVSRSDLSAVPIQSDSTSSQDQASSTDDDTQQGSTSTSPTQPTASSTEGDDLSTTTVAIAGTTSPVTDNFDAGFSGWSNYASGWSTSVWSTSTSDCYSDNCLSEVTFDQQYENIKKGTATNAGAFVLYFRNNGYAGFFGAGVCTDDTPTECQDFSRLGGADALVSFINGYRDNVWHYIYFAFRDGVSQKEYCEMVDDDTPEECPWQTSSVASGTTYADVLFFTSNGLNSGTSFYWDELGLAPHPPTGP